MLVTALAEPLNTPFELVIITMILTDKYEDNNVAYTKNCGFRSHFCFSMHNILWPMQVSVHSSENGILLQLLLKRKSTSEETKALR